MSITISHPTGILDCVVKLPASKSESNRILILEALSKGKISSAHLSDARDTQLLQAALMSDALEIDIQDAGTAMRFLTACYCATGQHKVLTGSARMKERPIGILVSALRDIGFDIRYLEKEGYAPLEIVPAVGELKNEVHIAGDVSSQYISALLMIAPVLPAGLTIYFDKELSSRPYIELTLDIMAKAGIEHEWISQTPKSPKGDFNTNAGLLKPPLGGLGVKILPQVFAEKTLSPSMDWSSAAYWYAIAAHAERAEIKLSQLSFDTAQGDEKVAEWMEAFGITTEQNPEGLILLSNQSKNHSNQKNHINHSLDFSDNPDLAQTIIVLCAAKNIPATFTGLQSLRIKETDRIAALQNELMKFGVELKESGHGRFSLTGDFVMSQQSIETYGDHRMAMAFAPLALIGEITIEDPGVVEKSYPGFWREMENAGFVIKKKWHADDTDITDKI